MLKKQKVILPRILYIHNRLLKKKEKEKVNANILAKEYEISVRTILRDIDFMRNFLNLPIDYNNKKRTYQYDKNFNIKSSYSYIEILNLFFRQLNKHKYQ
jgi:predicted DNA-binding transcriptional regulator YafY